MSDIPLVSVTNFVTARSRIGLAQQTGLLLALLMLGACDRPSNPTETINLKLYQNWQLQPGDKIAGYLVVAGLGDISIELNGKSVYAPFNGQTQQDQRNCLIFSSPDVPAYLFRLCGISNPRFGNSQQGDSLGTGTVLHFATLRKQPDGTWAIVEPSKPVMERILTKS
ncbi:MAG: hypothetical protein LH647_14825 [Leptolyngbyaceae cyanobacterium CAN_BIN12]|nr:hypothetical protein [Leptolyngbyaceae cyanobacterium CAN_BIN12]